MSKLELMELPTDNLPEAKRKRQRVYALYEYHPNKPNDTHAVFYGRKGKELADFLLAARVEE